MILLTNLGPENGWGGFNRAASIGEITDQVVSIGFTRALLHLPGEDYKGVSVEVRNVGNKGAKLISFEPALTDIAALILTTRAIAELPAGSRIGIETRDEAVQPYIGSIQYEMFTGRLTDET